MDIKYRQFGLDKKVPPNDNRVFFRRHVPLNPIVIMNRLYVRMNGKADKYDLRLRIVPYAKPHGVKPAAAVFDTTPKTMRKWLRRYEQERLAGLNEWPRIPLRCPHKTSAAMERKVVALREQYPDKGAKRLKREHRLTCSQEAIRRILTE